MKGKTNQNDDIQFALTKAVSFEWRWIFFGITNAFSISNITLFGIKKHFLLYIQLELFFSAFKFDIQNKTLMYRLQRKVSDLSFNNPIKFKPKNYFNLFSFYLPFGLKSEKKVFPENRGLHLEGVVQIWIWNKNHWRDQRYAIK